MSATAPGPEIASSDTNVVPLFFPSQNALFDNSSLFYSPGVWDQLEVVKSPQEKAGLSKAGGRERLCLLQADRLPSCVQGRLHKAPWGPRSCAPATLGCSAGRSSGCVSHSPLPAWCCLRAPCWGMTHRALDSRLGMGGVSFCVQLVHLDTQVTPQNAVLFPCGVLLIHRGGASVAPTSPPGLG